jgi:hypothetical protein
VTLVYSGGGAIFATAWAPAACLFGIGMINSSLQTLCAFQPVEWRLPLAHNLIWLGLLAKTKAAFRQRHLMI